MKFKSIRLQGFKSFPEKTEIEFHQGITSVVGPNGSGKSNITDALRWVLGEQSVKTLRGAKMEDVIFNGTESRRPLGFAEVVLTLDNEDGQLDIPYSEVEVRRRLYRSGESEYAINGHRCRLKDIVELFMDSGIGRDGYSMVGQGRIDEVLSPRSEDRRQMFDEAAGISRYRARKEEADRKLLRTEQNLQRVQDIQREIETRLKPLERQAEAARRALELKTELRELDLLRLFHEIELSRKDLEEKQEQFEIMRETLAEQEEKREAFIRENEAAQARFQQLLHQKELRQQNFSNKQREQEQIKFELERIRDRKRMEQDQWARMQEDLKRDQARLQQLSQDLSATPLEHQLRWQEKQQDLENKLKQASEALEAKNQSLKRLKKSACICIRKT